MSVLEKRVETLEAATAVVSAGCEPCSGVLVVVKDAITGALHPACWNGEALTEDELGERQTEAKSPKCGRDLSEDVETVIMVGGKEGSS